MNRHRPWQKEDVVESEVLPRALEFPALHKMEPTKHRHHKKLLTMHVSENVEVVKIDLREQNQTGKE